MLILIIKKKSNQGFPVKRFLSYLVFNPHGRFLSENNLSIAFLVGYYKGWNMTKPLPPKKKAEEKIFGHRMVTNIRMAPRQYKSWRLAFISMPMDLF